MEKRWYKVTYSRIMGGSNKRLEIKDITMRESGLKQILNDTKSKFAYIVKSAILIETGDTK